MVVEIRDDDMPLRVDGDVVRPGQVVRLAAARPELGEEFAVELKDVDARGLVVHHDQGMKGEKEKADLFTNRDQEIPQISTDDLWSV